MGASRMKDEVPALIGPASQWVVGGGAHKDYRINTKVR